MVASTPWPMILYVNTVDRTGYLATAYVWGAAQGYRCHMRSQRITDIKWVNFGKLIWQ